jgi:glutathione S-transferase
VKLYASAASSFARKIRIILIEKDVEHDVQIVNLWQSNDLKSTNPIGKVPALRLDDGRVLIPRMPRSASKSSYGRPLPMASWTP